MVTSIRPRTARKTACQISLKESRPLPQALPTRATLPGPRRKSSPDGEACGCGVSQQRLHVLAYELEQVPHQSPLSK